MCGETSFTTRFYFRYTCFVESNEDTEYKYLKEKGWKCNKIALNFIVNFIFFVSFSPAILIYQRSLAMTSLVVHGTSITHGQFRSEWVS